MARFVYLAPVESVSGKLIKNQPLVLCHKTRINQYGQKTNYNTWRAYNPNRVFTETQREMQIRFGAIVQMVSARKTNPVTAAQDLIAFKAQSRYKTLTKYLWSVCSAEYDSAQENG